MVDMSIKSLRAQTSIKMDFQEPSFPVQRSVHSGVTNKGDSVPEESHICGLWGGLIYAASSLFWQSLSP